MSFASPPPDLSLVCSEASIQERFRRLADEWKEQSRYLSNAAKLAMLKPYQRIIGLGLPVVPLILDELQASPTSGSGRWNRSLNRTQFLPRPREKFV